VKRYLIAILIAGCGPGFSLSLPDRFVELSEQSNRGQYELRATTPDGVVVGVEVIDNRDRGSLEFYQEAILRRMRDQQGYALLSEEEIHAASGQPGHLMRFGRDLNGRSYRYTLAVFASESSSIYLVEAGGREEQYTALEAQIETSISAMRF
jgi:hypothetical protein